MKPPGPVKPMVSRVKGRRDVPLGGTTCYGSLLSAATIFSSHWPKEKSQNKQTTKQPKKSLTSTGAECKDPSQLPTNRSSTLKSLTKLLHLTGI